MRNSTSPSPLALARRMVRLLPALAASWIAVAASAATVLVNPGDAGENTRIEAYTALRTVVESVLRREKIAPVEVKLSMDATDDLSASRARIPDLFVAPAHVIGSAVRYGYEPLVVLNQPAQAVLVGRSDISARDLAGAHGLRLGLPREDSIVTYLLRGEVNAINSTLKRHFAIAFQSRYQDALLTCLQMRQCDVVAVEKSVYQRWMASGAQLRSLMESRPVPGLGVAIKSDLLMPGESAGLRSALVNAFASDRVALPGRAEPANAAAFDYVSTLGYFTPRSLAGTKIVDAPEVERLMRSGVVYVDTRVADEYAAGHVPGARSVTYHEKSAKGADFDASVDRFDLTALPNDRATPIIFGCNGPECWKSFKASQAALKAGYKQVYWFRGGAPEWRTSGRSLDTAAPVITAKR